MAGGRKSGELRETIHRIAAMMLSMVSDRKSADLRGTTDRLDSAFVTRHLQLLTRHSP